MKPEKPRQAGLNLLPDEPLSASVRVNSTAWLETLPPAAECLFPDQRELFARMAESAREHRRTCVQGSTGLGKTHLIAALNACAVNHDLRVLNLATRTRLVRQLHERLDQFGVGHGVLAAKMPGLVRWSQRSQIASVDTLYRRCVADQKMPLPGADVVVFDEAHLALGATRQAILNAYPNAWIFGFTATPATTNGRPLRDQFDSLVLGPPAQELIRTGRLVRPRIFSKPIVTAQELGKLHKSRATDDYVTSEASALMSRPKLVGDVVQNWLRIANGLKTLVFACDKAHGAELVREYKAAGIAAEQLTDDDEEDVREEAIARLEAGVTTVLVNCFLLSYGTDIPSVQCVVLARPTRSIVLARQAIGRGMRTAAGKEYFILIDHGRVVENLGRPTEEIDWALDCGNINAQVRERVAKERKQADEKNRHCPECDCDWLVSEEGSACPSCQWKPVIKAKPVRVVQADLEEIDPEPTYVSAAVVESFYREALGFYAKRWPVRWMERQDAGRWWAWSQTRTKFEFDADAPMPSRFRQLAQQQPSAAVSGWCLSQVIRHAKSKPRKAA